MSTPNMTNSELSALIRETQSQLKDLLKSEDAVLAAAPAMNKADDKSAPPSDDKKEESAPPSDSASPAAPDAGSSAPPDASAAPAADASAPPEAPPAAPDASAAPGSAPAADPASDPAAAAGSAGGDSLATLVAAYSQVAAQPNGLENLRAHFMALNQVIKQSMAAASAAPAAGVPGAPPVAPAASAAAPLAPAPVAPAAPPADAGLPVADDSAGMAMKNEKTLLEKLGKSEADVADLKKKVETLTKGLEMVLRKPERKALTGKDVAGLVKAEPEKVDPTKLKDADLRKKLADVAKNPELKKSDRDLITAWFNRKVSAADLAPLFDVSKK